MRPSLADPTLRRLPGLCLLALLLVLPAAALAWGRPAHRLVANLAEARLRPAARAEALRLLGTEGASSLAEVSDWADEVREAGGHQAHSTRRWHFVDFLGGGCEYVPARDCPDGDCVVAAINRQFLVLADRRRTDAERVEALKFLVHLVADIHQPLHASPIDDKGGQQFQVGWHGKGRNLHSVWDALIVDRALQAQSLDETGYLRQLESKAPLPPDPTRRSDRPSVDWAQESCRIVKDEGIYPPAHVIGDDYLDAQRPRAEQQLRRAGARLADMLNFALDPARPAATP